MTGRRAAGLVAGILAIAVLGAAVAGAVYVTQAEPLEAGAVYAWPVGSRNTGIGYEGIEQFQVPFEADGEILWGVEVRNQLAVPVVIRGIRPLLSELAPLVVAEDLRHTRGDDPSLEPADLRPFEPVELAPGSRVFLVVREQFAACEPAHESFTPGGGLVRETLPLDATVLGIPRSAEVTLPFAILYSAPPGDCPPS